MSPLLFAIGYAMLGVAVGGSWRLASRGRVDWFGCAAVGVLWPATLLFLAVWAMLLAWVDGITEGLDDSPPVCGRCGLFEYGVSIAGAPQARCSCCSADEVDT